MNEHTPDLKELKDLITLFKYSLGDLWSWDAYNGDIINNELGIIQEALESIEIKQKEVKA